MSAFRYFLPGQKLIDCTTGGKFRRAVAQQFGLDDVLGDLRAVPDEAVISDVPTGPGQLAGVIVVPKSPTGEDPLTWSYDPSSQTWLEMRTPGCERAYWIGWETERPPTPEDLARPRQYRDYSFEDAAGRRWGVPTARSDSRVTSVPAQYGFDANGAMRLHVAPEFESLWQLSGEVLDHLRDVAKQDERWCVMAAIRTLAVNYRVSPASLEVLRTLGLSVLDRGSVAGVLWTLVDHSLGEEWLQKKARTMTDETPAPSAPDSTSASRGSTATCPATDPAAELSKSPAGFE